MSILRRAYSILEVKSSDDDKRTFSGIATTPKTDLMEDIVEPEGAEFKLPIPLLWQHNAAQPIGHVTRAKVTKHGIEVEGHIAKIDEDGTLKSRLDEAWQSIKSGLVRGLSIGFRSLEESAIKGTYGYRFIRWRWLELSAVTIPANSEATFTAVKSFDDQIMAASGRISKNIPGVSGQPNKRKNTMKTIQEQLADLLEARQVKSARMNEIADLVKDQSREFDEAEANEFDDLETEVKQLDGDIRMKKVECMNATTTRTVEGHTQRSGSTSRGPTILKRTEKDEDFKGQNYVRMIIAKALANIDNVNPISIAQKRWGKHSPMLVDVLKADIGAADSGTQTWAQELVAADARYNGDFIEFLKARTVYDRLPLRTVPANVTIKGQDAIGTGYWVGEGAAIPATSMTFLDVTLTPLKVAALAVITNEVLRDSSPSAEMLVRDSLEEASRQKIDSTFLGNAAASAGVYPAGMLYDTCKEGGAGALVAINTNGTDSVALRADVAALYAPFITAKNASGLHFVMNPALAKQIQLLTNALGLAEFAGISQNGGTLLGDPVVTGDSVGAGDLILLKPSDIWRIGDSGVQVSISREAMIEMANNPGMNSVTPVAATQKTVSMFQTESTAIKVVRSINFQKRRCGVVQFVDDADYSGIDATTTTAGG
jgi:HK97 family phage major capsid protein/HK97 family phage prohead protease